MTSKNRTKIYCAGAIRGDTQYSNELNLPSLLEGDPDFYERFETRSEKTYPKKYPLLSEDKTAHDVFIRDIRWLKESKAVIAEVSGNSTGTGWEICLAQHILDIPVLCLLKKGVTPPYVIGGNTHRNIYLTEYSTIDDLQRSCIRFLKGLYVENTSDVSESSSGAERLPRLSLATKSQKVHPVDRYFSIEFHSGRNLSIGVTYPCESAVDDVDASEYLAELVESPALKSAGGRLKEVCFGDSDTYEKHFRELVRWVSKANGLILDVSCPSTDIGWLTCYGQARHKRIACTYKSSAVVSYMILGNMKAHENILARRAPEISDKASESLRRKSFGEIKTGKSYGSMEEWRKFVLYHVNDCRNALQSGMSGRTVDRQLQLFFERSGDLASPFEKLWENRLDITSGNGRRLFLLKAIILNDRWNRITRQGFTGTFISGEREKLIMVLPRYERTSGPKDLYEREKQWIGYEERALAKNIRAFKDIGLLLMAGEGIDEASFTFPLGESNGRSYRQAEFILSSEVDRNQRLLTFRQRRRTGVVPESIILSKYCYSLSDFLVENGTQYLKSFLRKVPNDMGLGVADEINIDDDNRILAIERGMRPLRQLVDSEQDNLGSRHIRGR